MMKKIISILFVVMLLGLVACANDNDGAGTHNENVVNNNTQNDDVKEVVWNQLSSEQKEWIDDSWEDGKTSEVTLSEEMMTQIDDKSYQGKEVYLIDFPTKNKSIPNNMIVYADKDTFQYIGNGLVD